jgi:CelD/BcsL family acetyltransferase involved in cellulose biosynthesis
MSSVVITDSITLEAAGAVDAGCRVEVVSDYQTLLALQPAWDELAAHSGAVTPFMNHAWVRTWWDCFGGDKTLHVLTVRAGAKLIAIAPLMWSSTRMCGVKLRRLSFLENDHTPRCGFILSPAYEQQACRAIWNHLHTHEHWDVLELNHLPAGCVTLGRLSALALGDRYLVGLRQLERSPYVPLTGDWESYFKHLGYNHRRGLRKRLNRLNRRGRVEVEVITGTDALTTVLDDGFRIEAAAWKEQNGTAMRSDPAVRRFYESYAERAAALGTLRLMFLKFDGVRIAFNYSLYENNTLYVLKSGYDPAYAAYSPSNVLCHHVLRDCFARGVAEFDFLGDNEAWKLEWASEARSHHGLLVFRRMWETQLIYAVKCRFLPLLQRHPLYLRLRDAVLHRRRGRRAFLAAASASKDGDDVA